MSEPQSVLVVAGETSGEQHASGLIEEVQRLRPEAFQWFGSGGPEMRNLGVELIADVSELAAIGPRAALSNAADYWRLFRDLQKEVTKRRAKLAILVDFPEFNLRLARRLKKLGLRVCYFISPQIWAWRPARVKIVRDYVDQMLVIFPFEVEFYRDHGVEAVYVGNPLRRLSAETSGSEQGNDPPRVVLFPGSRRKEADIIYPIQLSAVAEVQANLPCRVEVGVAPGIEPAQLVQIEQRWRQSSGQHLDLEYHPGDSMGILKGADCAIIKSGTSTLQAMVLGVPFAMVYRMSELSYRMLRPLVRTDTYCLANLVAGSTIVPEFVQSEARARPISRFVSKVIEDQTFRSDMKQNLRNASERLGDLNAYAEAGRHFVELAEGQEL